MNQNLAPPHDVDLDHDHARDALIDDTLHILWKDKGEPVALRTIARLLNMDVADAKAWLTGNGRGDTDEHPDSRGLWRPVTQQGTFWIPTTGHHLSNIPFELPSQRKPLTASPLEEHNQSLISISPHPMTTATTETNKPIVSIPNGSINVAIFANERQKQDGTPFTAHNAVVTASYKDKDDNWQEQKIHISRHQLIALARTALDAYGESGTVIRETNDQ